MKRGKMSSDRYGKRGVSHAKPEVHAVVDKMDRGLYPGAFCKITKDYLSGNAKKCSIIHSDGSGTKSILGYLHYKETGDASVFRGIAQDSIVMNLDDLICVGAVKNILISSTINRNARRCPGEVLAALIEGTESTLAEIRNLGVSIFSGGGETADVGDLTGTIVVDTCAVVSMNRSHVVDNSKITSDLVIIGFSSAGKSKYEKTSNSGIGSNGLTSARHELLSSYYAKNFPETVDSLTDPKLVYCGSYRMQDRLPNDSKMKVGEALLSPTRTYAPIIAAILKENPKALRGIVHCSGGGQTKCLRFGKNVHYIKDNLFAVPPIFSLIEEESKTPRLEMYQVFNMGHRMEVYCKPKEASWIIEVAQSFGVEAQIIGRTESGKGNSLDIRVGKENFHYKYK